MLDARARWLGILAAAAIAGICGGLFGIGGGTLLVPILALLFSFDQQSAQGTSLIALVPPTGLLAFLAYYHAHQVNITAGLLLIPGVFFGGIVGGKIANALTPHRMRVVFAALLFVLGAWEVAAAWMK